MVASAQFSAKNDFFSRGALRGNFVYEGANGPFLPLSATACVYDALPELMPSYSAQLRPGTVPWGTGKERDSETGLDYFGARYYSGAQGRFSSPDAALIGQAASNPQSWNLYAYVTNNPQQFPDMRTQGAPSVHMHGDGLVHMDTGNPWNNFPLGFLTHAFIDVLLGNINGDVPFMR
jgi:RHS repeat-associated protein